MPHTNTIITQSCEGIKLCSKPQEVRTPSLTEVRLPRVPFFIGFGSCEAHTRQVDQTSRDVPSPLSEVCCQCKDSYVHIGLLESTEKTVKLGRMHMRPFQWHLKTHWKYPMPLDTPVTWNQRMIRHQGEFLHPREHEKLIFTDAS